MADDNGRWGYVFPPGAQGAYLMLGGRVSAMTDARAARELLQETGHAGEYVVDEMRGHIVLTVSTRGAA